MRAKSLNLVGAEMAVRIEKSGAVTVFAGANKRPIATAAPALTAASPGGIAEAAVPGPLGAGAEDLAGLLAWIDGLGATGLDGHDLRELGLKNGNLTVDDERNGKHWTFSKINVSLMRPTGGGITFRLSSDNTKQPWVLSAAMRPVAEGVRAIGLEARNVSSADILLALRLNEAEVEANLPVSASVRAEVSSAGVLQRMQGRVVAGHGNVVDHGDDDVNVDVERADIRFNWDAAQHALVIPFQVHAGGNQFTMRATLRAPSDKSGLWTFDIARGDAVIDPIILAGSANVDPEGFAINRVTMHGRIDTKRRRIDLIKGDLTRIDTRPLYNIGIALTGSLDYSGSEPHLAFGIACTRMPGSVLKRIWPIFANYAVRQWVEEHAFGGVVEHVVIAGNAPMPDFRPNGPPMPPDGFSVDLETSGTTVKPLTDMPAIHDADLTLRVVGRHASVSLARGTVDVAPGRKLNVADGIFDVPDVHPKPAAATARFRVDGAVPAAAALLSSEGMRDTVGLTLDPDSTRGTVSARVAVNLLVGRNVPRDSSTYSVAATLTNFGADKLVMGRKIEASTLRVSATNKGYQVKGDVKIDGAPAAIDIEKKPGEEARLLLQAKLDERARHRLGIDLGDAVTGVIPIKVSGDIGSDVKDGKLDVEADLTQAKIDNMLPGWKKPAGKPAHASYTLVKTPKTVRFDNLTIAGSGADVKGSVEFDGAGEIVSANLPQFALSGGDKAALKAERASDGVLHVAMRGDVYDGRNFVKSSMAGGEKRKPKSQGDRPRSRRQAGGGGGLQRRDPARPRSEDVAAQRARAQLQHESQDRSRHAAQRRPAPAPARQPPGRLFRDRRCRRAVPFHRHVSAHVWRADVGGDGSAERGPEGAGRHALCAQFHRARRAHAQARDRRRARPAGRRRAVLRGAHGFHALPRPHVDPRRRGARAGGGRDGRGPDRLRQERRASARHLRAVLRPQQSVRADPGGRPDPGRRRQ